MSTQDVPSPIDLQVMHEAQAWALAATQKRPYRRDFFARFAHEVLHASPRIERVLELGSGPGFLAEQVLQANPGVAITLLDNSAAMHELAQTRLSAHPSQVRFIQRSFQTPDWPAGLGTFACVVTHQAVHELRHKRHATALHAQVRSVLAPGGMYLVCDHFAGEGGMQNDQLYMTPEEQQQALVRAGFQSVQQIMRQGSLVLHRACKPH